MGYSNKGNRPSKSRKHTTFKNKKMMGGGPCGADIVSYSGKNWLYAKLMDLVVHNKNEEFMGLFNCYSTKQNVQMIAWKSVENLQSTAINTFATVCLMQKYFKTDGTFIGNVTLAAGYGTFYNSFDKIPDAYKYYSILDIAICQGNFEIVDKIIEWTKISNLDATLLLSLYDKVKGFAGIDAVFHKGLLVEPAHHIFIPFGYEFDKENFKYKLDDLVFDRFEKLKGKIKEVNEKYDEIANGNLFGSVKPDYTEIEKLFSKLELTIDASAADAAAARDAATARRSAFLSDSNPNDGTTIQAPAEAITNDDALAAAAAPAAAAPAALAPAAALVATKTIYDEYNKFKSKVARNIPYQAVSYEKFDSQGKSVVNPDAKNSWPEIEGTTYRLVMPLFSKEQFEFLQEVNPCIGVNYLYMASQYAATPAINTAATAETFGLFTSAEIPKKVQTVIDTFFFQFKMTYDTALMYDSRGKYVVKNCKDGSASSSLITTAAAAGGGGSGSGGGGGGGSGSGGGPPPPTSGKTVCAKGISYILRNGTENGQTYKNVPEIILDMDNVGTQEFTGKNKNREDIKLNGYILSIKMVKNGTIQAHKLEFLG